MGSELIISPWLQDMALRPGRYAGPAARIMRVQAVTYNRRRHRLDLDNDQVRRRIMAAAAYGSVSATPVSCTRCHWSARLTDWARACDASDEAIAAALAACETDRQRAITAFLRPCVGEVLAAQFAESPHAPAERR